MAEIKADKPKEECCGKPLKVSDPRRKRLVKKVIKKRY